MKYPQWLCLLQSLISMEGSYLMPWKAAHFYAQMVDKELFEQR